MLYMQPSSRLHVLKIANLMKQKAENRPSSCWPGANQTLQERLFLSPWIYYSTATFHFFFMQQKEGVSLERLGIGCPQKVLKSNKKKMRHVYRRLTSPFFHRHSRTLWRAETQNAASVSSLLDAWTQSLCGLGGLWRPQKSFDRFARLDCSQDHSRRCDCVAASRGNTAELVSLTFQQRQPINCELLVYSCAIVTGFYGKA